LKVYKEGVVVVCLCTKAHFCEWPW